MNHVMVKAAENSTARLPLFKLGSYWGHMEKGVLLLPKVWVALMNYLFGNVLKEFAECKGFVISIQNMSEASGIPILF